MKYITKNTAFLLIIVGIFASHRPVTASLPDPLIHLDFEDNLANHGTLGETAYIVWPEFSEGVIAESKALNLRGVKRVGVKIGHPNGSIQGVLNGLRSFTICMWVKFDELPGTRSYLWSRRSDSGPWDYVLRLYQDQWGRPRQTVNVNDGPLSPYSYWGVLDKWQFVAVTYDGAAAAQNEIFYQRPIDDATMRVVIRDHNAGDLMSSGFPLEFGADIEGLIDEVRVFGSKTDGSGVLSKTQLEQIVAADMEYTGPDPVFDDPFGALVYLPFENDWNNHGWAQPDSSVVSFINGVRPEFGPGLRMQGLDLRAAQMGKSAGCINFGITGTQDTPVETALNGLKSFTICGWFNTASPGNRLLTNTGICGRLGQVMLRSYDNASHLVLGVNNQWTPVDADVTFDEDNEWVFWAVTYDSTKADHQVCWYKGLENLQTGVHFLKSQTLLAGALAVKYDEFTVANLLASGAYSFSGLFDEFRFFGNPNDHSGALDWTQLQAIYDYSLRPVCGEPKYESPPGDVNADCIVDFADLAAVGAAWQTHYSD